jgi:NAD(P)H-hydrate epimerase
VLCGKGNNGGDGFVAARHLLDCGANVRVWTTVAGSDLNGAARANHAALPADRLAILPDEADGAWTTLTTDLARADLIIDALLGTGVRGVVTGTVATAIDLINAAGRPVLAVDVPSGVAADTGQICGRAVRATATITLGLSKPGLLLHPGAGLAGTLLVGDIGLPAELTAFDPGCIGLLTAEDLASLLPRRAVTAHKGDAGRALLVAGSRGFTGAAALAATAALRGGAGLVTVLTPASVQPVLAVKLTEAMTAPLPDTDGALAPGAEAALRPWLARADAIALGPGLGTGSGSRTVTLAALAEAGVPLVLDADALNVIAVEPDPAATLAGARADVVITPHPGEMARLTRVSVPEIESDRLGAARRFAAAAKCCVVLKGVPTVIALPDGTTWLNRTGNPGMASGGMGDALTGLITALIAQGLPVAAAARAGVWLHGLAGDLAAREIGDIGIIAGDLIARIPAARRRLTTQAAESAGADAPAHSAKPRLIEIA